jgi:hypothetical protein
MNQSMSAQTTPAFPPHSLQKPRLFMGVCCKLLLFCVSWWTGPDSLLGVAALSCRVLITAFRLCQAPECTDHLGVALGSGCRNWLPCQEVLSTEILTLLPPVPFSEGRSTLSCADACCQDQQGRQFIFYSSLGES